MITLEANFILNVRIATFNFTSILFNQVKNLSV